MVQMRGLAQINKTPFYLPDLEIVEFAMHLVADEVLGKESWGEVRLPGDAKRHGTSMLIGLGTKDPGDYRLFMLDELVDRPSGDPTSLVSEAINGKLVTLGNFTAGAGMMLDSDRFHSHSEEENLQTSELIVHLAFILSLMNQPTIARLVPRSLANRQQRRAQARKGKPLTETWHEVRWNIGEDAVKRLSRDPSFRKMPLHWRRGHHREAEPHYRGAFQRKDALDPAERDLWWQWIEGSWVGHPAFGLKLSMHAPKLGKTMAARLGAVG